MRFVPRKSLPHEVPSWVASGGLYCITLRAADATPALTSPAIGRVLLTSIQDAHESHGWFAGLFLVMPDHVHGLFSREGNFVKVVRDWKRDTARHAGIHWQRDFFEHRLRDDENWEMKAACIRDNPARKQLVKTPAEWPWIFEGK